MQRKTKPIYVIQCDYGQGWEDVAREEIEKEAEDRLKAYQDKTTEHPYQLITRLRVYSAKRREAQRTQIKLSPFGAESDATIVLYKGTRYEYGKLLSAGKQTGSTAVFSRGIIDFIEKLSMPPEELAALGRDIHPTLVNSLPFTQGVGYGVFELFRKGYPLAGEALAQLAEFYKFSYDYQDFLQWTAIVSENS